MRFAFFFALGVCLELQAASAQECACSEMPMSQRIVGATYTFEVRVRGTGDLCDGNIYHEGERPWLTEVEVIGVRKGKAPENRIMFLRHDKSSEFCGVSFSSGDRYLVLAASMSGGFT